MLRKFFPLWLLMAPAILAVSVSLWAMPPLQALAQCGDYPPDSSCSTCHAEAYPVFEKGEWHAIHARKDCCWNCHGGNTAAQDKDLAHVGLEVQPLGDTYTSCYSCHPYDYRLRAGRFAVVLGVTPGSSEPVARSTEVWAPSSAPLVVQLDTASPVSEPFSPWLWLATLAAGVFLLGLGTLWRKRSHS